MDFQAIVDRLKALSVPGLVDVDLPRPVNKAEKDPGRGGQPFVIVEPARIVDFLRVCRDDERLGFELLIDITASDPSADDENLWVLIELLSVKHKHRLSIKAFLPKAAASLPSATARRRSVRTSMIGCLSAKISSIFIVATVSLIVASACCWSWRFVIRIGSR